MPKYFPLFISLALPAFINAQTASNPELEIKSERSMYSKVFLKANGEHEAIISPAPVHYKKNGVWEEINTTITSDNAGYKNESNVIQSYFPARSDSSGKIKLVVNSGNEIFIHSEKKLVLLDNQANLNTITLNPNNSIGNVSNNTLNYSGIYPGISDEFTVLNGEIKNNVVLSALPALLNNVSSGYFGFQETLNLPEGWKITTQDSVVNSLTSSPLSIVDSKGNRVLTIPEPVFFDNYGSAEDDGAHPVTGKYLVKQENNCWAVTTVVPVTWLKDVNTKYPVSIDPTVIIPGTTGGWQSPVNFVDNSGFVFVGVCCGNGTHRAWIKFNVSSIPANSCITNVEFEPYVVTENSTNPQVVLVNDVTGAYGPYGGINAAAYNDFGNGNYTNFTLTVLGLYGYYALGATACAQLQAAYPSGLWQIAFQFQNEPSTDWKNMSATNCNLRVTYSACVLPVELLSFDGKCDNGKVNLTWETASQTNNGHFTLERSANGIDYESIGTVAGAGNSSQTLHYSFADPNPLDGTSYYRLKQTDFDGHSEYLKTVAVSCFSPVQIEISPNPGTGIFFISGAEQNSSVLITNVLGQVVSQTKITGDKTEIDLSNHSNGIYFVRIFSNSGSVSKKVLIDK